MFNDKDHAICNKDDVLIIYRVALQVDDDMQEIKDKQVWEDFDEYQCTNCGEYFEYQTDIVNHLAMSEIKYDQIMEGE